MRNYNEIPENDEIATLVEDDIEAIDWDESQGTQEGVENLVHVITLDDQVSEPINLNFTNIGVNANVNVIPYNDSQTEIDTNNEGYTLVRTYALHPNMELVNFGAMLDVFEDFPHS